MLLRHFVVRAGYFPTCPASQLEGEKMCSDNRGPLTSEQMFYIMYIL